MPPRSPAARAGPVRGLVPPPARNAPCLAALGLTPSRRTSMHLLGQVRHAPLKVLGAGRDTVDWIRSPRSGVDLIDHLGDRRPVRPERHLRDHIENLAVVAESPRISGATCWIP